MTRRIGWLVAPFALLALSAPGCAAISAHRAHDKIMETEVGGHRYSQPIELVWPQVKRMLADFGLALGGKDAEAMGQSAGFFHQLTSSAKETSPGPGGGLVLETDWTNGGRRWRAEARPDAGGCRIVLTKIIVSTTEHGHDGWSERDLELELALMRRIDPEAANRIDDLLEPPDPAHPAKAAIEPASPAGPLPPPPPTVPVPAIRVE